MQQREEPLSVGFGEHYLLSQVQDMSSPKTRLLFTAKASGSLL
jgi:hypothetical protein